MTTNATLIGPGFAQMNGEINPNGSHVSGCYFQLSSPPTPDRVTFQNSTIPCGQAYPVGSGSKFVKVWGLLGNGDLRPTHYSYRLVAASTGGTGTGGDVGFTTPPVAAFKPVTQHNKNILAIIAQTTLTAGAAVGCGLALAADLQTVGTLTFLAVDVCGADVLAGADLGAVVADPPDPNYQTVFAPRPFPVPRVPERCKGIAHAQCHDLRSAERRYLRATAHATSLAEAAGVTSNRYGGAVSAGNTTDIQKQATAEKRYVPRLMTALNHAKKAGRKLGQQLARDHLNPTFSARQVARARKRLKKLQGIPRSVIARLKADGAISSRSDLRQIIDGFLVKAPPAKPTKLATAVEAW